MAKHEPKRPRRPKHQEVRWAVYQYASNAQYLGTVVAINEEAALKRAAVAMEVPRERRFRLAVWKE